MVTENHIISGSLRALLPIVAIGGISLCIWLTVRIVNRRERWAKRSLAALLGLPALYIASYGPACWICAWTGVSVLPSFYRPIGSFIALYANPTTEKAFRSYAKMGMPPNEWLGIPFATHPLHGQVALVYETDGNDADERRQTVQNHLAAVATLLSPFGDGDRGLPKSRSEFASAFERIENEMPRSEVEAILGRPDQVRGDADLGKAAVLLRAIEQWRYGNSSTLGAATLGSVYFDRRGRVAGVWGKGTVHSAGVLSEEELREIFAALGQAPSYDGDFDPRRLIRVVNLLQPLGKTRALAAMDEFLRVTSCYEPGWEGVSLVLQTLFDIPPGSDCEPTMCPGQPFPSEPAEKTLLPKYPLVIEADLPFHVVRTYALFGVPESPYDHCRYFRQYGVMRQHPLSPTNDPVDALDRFMKSSRWRYRNRFGKVNRDVSADDNLHRQLLRLLETVIQFEQGEDGLPVVPENLDLHEMGDRLRDRGVTWDAKRCVYTSAN